MVGGGGVGGGATGKGKAGGGIVQLGKDAEQTKKRLQGLNGQVVRNEKTLKGFHTGFSNTGKEVEKSTGKLKAFGTETLHVSKKVIQFGAVTAVIRGVTSGFGDMVQNVFELDSALTEFKKVSNLTGKELERYTDVSNTLSTGADDDEIYNFEMVSNIGKSKESQTYRLPNTQKSRASEIENKINEALSGDIDLDVCVLLRMLNEKLGGKNG